MAEISTKEKLLNAALELFSKKGYSATSVDEIAEAVGMTGPSIYKYFKGKEDLLKGLTERAESEYKSKMQMNPDSMIRIHNKEKLKAFSLAQIRFTMFDENIVRMRRMHTIEQFRNENMSRLASLHQYYNILGLYGKIFSGLMEHGIMEKNDPEFMALEYISPVTMLLQLGDREPDIREELMTKIEKHIDFFIDKYIKEQGDKQ
ncbi:MAG: TetR/AcrR family transcriptional regulator [Lachnospiraceae bacterium]|nr:TetR/AcrR family transcriptional regulator [Lachnospiraceae bacterium]